MARQVFSVSQLNAYLKIYLRSDETLQDIWVAGEISNFHRHASGHCYFTLKDERSTLKAVMFKGQARSVKFEPASGLQVLIRGFIDIYEARGEYQIYVQAMEPAGLGALHLAFEQLKEKLEKEGLFAEEHKKSLPFFPRRIGVVTSPTGAVIRDIIKVLERRFRGLNIFIAPARVQGEGASAELAAGIDLLETFGVDVIIVARGGGSLEELWAFNDEELARRVFACSVPLISAVGHERDYTIIDFVADVRAATPSEAAEILIKPRQEMKREVIDFYLRLQKSMETMLASYRAVLDGLLAKRVLTHPLEAYYIKRQRIDELTQRLGYSIGQTVARHKEKFNTEIARLDGLSPLKIMSLGYSICRDPQSLAIIRHSEELQIEDDVELIFDQGKARATIKAIEV